MMEGTRDLQEATTNTACVKFEEEKREEGLGNKI
jgi:hypothetical protein